MRLSETLFDLRDSSMGSSGPRAIDGVLRIDPAAYRAFPYSQKAAVAAAVGKVNRLCQSSGKRLLLLAPGRLGTSSPELGVPLSFGDITAFTVVCEVADPQAGFMPELSYGSHMFQDLVEAEIAYGAVWGNEKTAAYHPELLDRLEDRFPALCPEYPEMRGMIRLVETPGLRCWLDSVENRAVCGFAREETDT